ncbi:hypothetical protein FACS1894152_2500 [Bacilli bacterium]|nr:hypothetical protein FACS1894152_2500 [Bacilli bacterium]
MMGPHSNSITWRRREETTEDDLILGVKYVLGHDADKNHKVQRDFNGKVTYIDCKPSSGYNRGTTEAGFADISKNGVKTKNPLADYVLDRRFTETIYPFAREGMANENLEWQHYLEQVKQLKQNLSPKLQDEVQKSLEELKKERTKLLEQLRITQRPQQQLKTIGSGTNKNDNKLNSNSNIFGGQQESMLAPQLPSLQQFKEQQKLQQLEEQRLKELQKAQEQQESQSQKQWDEKLKLLKQKRQEHLAKMQQLREKEKTHLAPVRPPSSQQRRKIPISTQPTFSQQGTANTTLSGPIYSNTLVKPSTPQKGTINPAIIRPPTPPQGKTMQSLANGTSSTNKSQFAPPQNLWLGAARFSKDVIEKR